MFNFDYDATKYGPHEIDLIYDILFKGHSALFNYSLSEQMGLIYDYDSRIERYSNIGRIYFSYEISFDDLYESLGASIKVLQNLKGNLSDFDFERAKLYVMTSTKMDNVEDANWHLSYDNHILSYGYSDFDEERVLYAKITKNRLAAVIQEIFRPENLTVAIRAIKKVDVDKIKNLVSAI